MAAMDFPSNPVDGQVSGSYVYSSTLGVWKAKSQSSTPAVISSTLPTTANPGDIWIDSSDGISYVYYNDGTSSQWIELMSSGVPQMASKADKTYVDSQDALKANLISPTFSGTVVMPSTTSIGNVDSTEISYLDGVTSGIQSQINARLQLTGGTLSGTLYGKDGTGGTVANSNETGSFSARGNSANAACISFHRQGVVAMNMGLDTDGYFRIGGWSWSGNRWQLGSDGSTYQPGNISLDGSVVHNYWRADLNRAWDNYPSITVYNTTDKGPQGEFRIHGYPGNNGGDFSIGTRSDGGFITGSDSRRKTNVEEISNALERINAMSGKTFNIINSEGDIETELSSEETGKKFGFIAQEVADIIPEAVKYYPEVDEPNEIGYASAYSIDYGSLVPLLLQGINELTQKVNDLEAKLNGS